MVLAVDEHLERRAAGVDPALEPARRARQHVLLAAAQQPELLLALAQVAAVDDAADRAALGDRAQHLAGDERRHAERVELAELILEARQEVLRGELEQDGVVALERREDVRVGLQRGEAVGAQVAGAAARLAARLDRVRRVPGGDRLQARRRTSRARAAAGRSAPRR